MSPTTTTAPAQTKIAGSGQRGRRTNRNKHNKRGGKFAASDTAHAPAEDPSTQGTETKGGGEGESSADNIDLCWICAEPVKYYSVSECNHRICHVCALRLRALYKKWECTLCKENQPSVIFTTCPDASYQTYDQAAMPLRDDKLAIVFETQEMMEETLILLRFNCPDPECDYIAKGWGDLKLHVRATHNKLMCDVCIRSKKVFAHEHALYTFPQLATHLPSMVTRQHHKAIAKEKIEGGIHPLCEFCRECFPGDDELYEHMRKNHEDCFVCKRNDIRDQYFLNYDTLEKHFHKVHYPCTQSACLARKFVVFGSPIDLQAHMVDEHGASMSSRDIRDARRIQPDFEFEQVRGRSNRGGGGGDGGGRGGRNREPPPRQQPHPGAAPSPTPTPAQAGPPRARRREGLGTGLTPGGSSGGGTPAATTPAGPSRRASPSPAREDVDPTTLDRHNSFVSRLSSYAPNSSTAVPAIKAAIRGYRANESSARDLISTIWNVLDMHLEHTASIVNAVVDLLDDEEKKDNLLTSWKTFDVEQRRQFPDLVPSAVGGGYAAITSGRVLNAKHSTTSRSSPQSTRQVWDRVAQAAGSTSSGASSSRPGPAIRSQPQQSVAQSFPPLRVVPGAAGAGTPANAPLARGPSGAPRTAWSASAAASSAVSRPIVPSSSTPAPHLGKPSPAPLPPSLSKNGFPELPTTNNKTQRPVINGNSSLRNILGKTSGPAVSAWGNGPAGGSEPPSPRARVEQEGTDDAPAPSGGGKKKGKGKQKQTLFTLGSFPTAA